METPQSTDDGTPALEKQKMDPRRAFITAWTIAIVVVCCLLYLMWEWYANPAATWQHWAWILIQVWVFIWVVSVIIRKTFSK
jgi:membrane protein YdbS with pleckstrin-like domain